MLVLGNLILQFPIETDEFFGPIPDLDFQLIVGLLKLLLGFFVPGDVDEGRLQSGRVFFAVSGRDDL